MKCENCGLDKVNPLVVCSRSGDDGCKAKCKHRNPHVEHEPYQTDCDDHNSCSMEGWCDDVGGMVRCLPHNDKSAPSDGWIELYEATADLMDSFTATGPKFDRVRNALKSNPNDPNEEE